MEVAFRIAGYQALYDVYSKPEAFWQRDPLLGWSFEPGARGEFVGPRPFPIQFRTQIRINSLGLRGEEIGELPPRGRRVVLLGDSMAAGFEVEEDQTYASLAEEELRETLDAPVQVVNAAVRGYGTDQAYLLYREQVRSTHPDVVVYHTTANDPEDNATLHRVRRPFGKPAFALRGDGSLEMVGHPIPNYPECSGYRLNEGFDVTRIDNLRSRISCWVQTRLTDRSALFSFIATRLAQNPMLLRAIYDAGTPEGGPTGAASTETDYTHRLTSVIIEKLARLAEQGGARFVLLGQRSDLDKLDVDGLSRRGIEVARLDEALGPSPGEDVRFPVDGHYNEKGHRLVGDFLARELEDLLRR